MIFEITKCHLKWTCMMPHSWDVHIRLFQVECFYSSLFFNLKQVLTLKESRDFPHNFLFHMLFKTAMWNLSLTMSWMLLKNSQTYFKNLAEWAPQDFKSIFGHFSKLCMKGLKAIYRLSTFSVLFSACHETNWFSVWRNNWNIQIS